MTILSVNDRQCDDATVQVLNGASRTVVLAFGMAFKFPSLAYGWKAFLRGLISNMNERAWAKAGYDERHGFCPVRFSLPGGFLVVMPQCDVIVGALSDERFREFSERSCCGHDSGVHTESVCGLCELGQAFHDFDEWVVPCENKEDSFGWYGGWVGGRPVEDRGVLVAVDYGD